MSKMSGYCPANQKINFDDIDFETFDRKSERFIQDDKK